MSGISTTPGIAGVEKASSPFPSLRDSGGTPIPKALQANAIESCWRGGRSCPSVHRRVRFDPIASHEFAFSAGSRLQECVPPPR